MLTASARGDRLVSDRLLSNFIELKPWVILSHLWVELKEIVQFPSYLNKCYCLLNTFSKMKTHQVQRKCCGWHNGSIFIFLFDSCLQTGTSFRHIRCIVLALFSITSYSKSIIFQSMNFKNLSKRFMVFSVSNYQSQLLNMRQTGVLLTLIKNIFQIQIG